jgi:hypothetical protein
MTEIAFSSSRIESWRRSLKHQWLYLNTLDAMSSLQRPVSLYVEEHNTRIPHRAFHGQTLDEMHFATGGHVPKELALRRKVVETARLEASWWVNEDQRKAGKSRDAPDHGIYGRNRRHRVPPELVGSQISIGGLPEPGRLRTMADIRAQDSRRS